MIERRGLTTPERVNKVISGERMCSDIPSLFLRRLQKTAGFGTKAVVGKAVIRQAFIRQMPALIRANLATQPDSATLESLAMLAARALASEADIEESKPGVDETTKLVGLLEDLSKRLKKLETATAAKKKRNQGRGRVNNQYTPRPTFIPNVQATEFVPNKPGNYNNAQATEFVANKPRIVLMHSKIFIRTHRRRKIMSRNWPTQPLHRFATTTRISVKRHVCAVNPVGTIAH